MMMDPDNPVVKLCVQGMQAEAEGRFKDARKLFSDAWQISAGDFEACLAAHYLARHQDEPAETLRWNQEALLRAQAVGDASTRSFYPSLYLNLGYSYEQLGDNKQAKENYELAARWLSALPDDSYGQIVRQGISAGLSRLRMLPE